MMSPKYIVLVEDDMNLRQSIALILQRAGYFITAVDCVVKAMDMIKTNKYQLIITDNNMPDSYDELLPKILGTYPNLAVLVLTDQSTSEMEKEGRLLSVHYLVKPIAPERLVEYVGIILGEESNSKHHRSPKKSNVYNL